MKVSRSSLEPEADSQKAVVLDNIQSNMSSDLLSMLVENVSGLKEGEYSLETIWEANAAVVIFNAPAGQTGSTQPQCVQVTQ